MDTVLLSDRLAVVDSLIDALRLVDRVRLWLAETVGLVDCVRLDVADSLALSEWLGLSVAESLLDGRLKLDDNVGAVFVALCVGEGVSVSFVKVNDGVGFSGNPDKGEKSQISNCDDPYLTHVRDCNELQFDVAAPPLLPPSQATTPTQT